eukprot:1366261-Amorphochlora_amoeboformis.AAC.1
MAGSSLAGLAFALASAYCQSKGRLFLSTSLCICLPWLGLLVRTSYLANPVAMSYLKIPPALSPSPSPSPSLSPSLTLTLTLTRPHPHPHLGLNPLGGGPFLFLMGTAIMLLFLPT